MNYDFEVFQSKLLCSLTPNVPLQANLRAVMAPALMKLKTYCRAKVAIHFFLNPEVREWHALLVGEGQASKAALLEELRRRHSPDHGLVPNPHLPVYHRISSRDTQSGRDVFKLGAEDYLEKLRGELLAQLTELAEKQPDEFSPSIPKSGDLVLIVPLATQAYPRLGYILLWDPSDELKNVFSDSKRREGRVAFRKMMELLLVRLFANFYQMRSHTYLPSYYQIDTKRVTLVCAEIREFDRAATILRQRHDFDGARRTQCLRSLVTRFNEAATLTVEKYHGRVDQVWGSGIVAVFGEYLDTDDASPTPGCKRALTMAAEFVQEFQRVAADWMKIDFCMEKYEGEYNAFVNVGPAVALDHGEVFFDYVGSSSHRVYMALGDHVDFVRQLASVAGRVVQDNAHSCQDFAEQQPRPGTICWLPEYQGPPILLSQPAHKWAKDMLQDPGGSTVGKVHVPFLISLPGRSERFPVYGVHPKNVTMVAP